MLALPSALPGSSFAGEAMTTATADCWAGLIPAGAISGSTGAGPGVEANAVPDAGRGAAADPIVPPVRRVVPKTPATIPGIKLPVTPAWEKAEAAKPGSTKGTVAKPAAKPAAKTIARSDSAKPTGANDAAKSSALGANAAEQAPKRPETATATVKR